jgi:hypothetical protein
MSNVLLSFPQSGTGAFGWNFSKYMEHNTVEQKTGSFRGSTYMPQAPYPIWHFEFNVPYLKGSLSDPTSTVSHVMGVIATTKGRADTFLFNDPNDNTVSLAQFGTGDGTTTAFQIARPIGGAAQADIIQNFNGQVSIFNNGTNIAERNILTDSDGTGSTWTGDSGLVFSSTGGLAGSGGKWTYTGTGSASTFRFKKSLTANVIPGQQYTLSGYIDATHVTSITGGAPPVWEVTDLAVANVYAAASLTIGTSGRASATFTVPEGVNQVVVILDTDNCTVASGTSLVFSNPQLEIASTASTYQSSNSAPYVLGSTGIVTFATAPAAGVPLTWSGNFYFRCRFTDDAQSNFRMIAPDAWDCSQLAWETVIL